MFKVSQKYLAIKLLCNSYKYQTEVTDLDVSYPSLTTRGYHPGFLFVIGGPVCICPSHLSGP